MADIKGFTESTIRDYLNSKDDVKRILGGTPESWTVSEVGDGNINFVWIVKGPAGGIVAKQALPYIRIAPTWELTSDRSFWEYSALTEEYKYVPAHVPKIYCHDKARACTIMEYLTPHIILRKGLIAATVYPHVGKHIAHFMAETLFHTSDLYLKSDEKRIQVAKYATNACIHITEKVVFTEPYITHKNNHWTNTEELNKVIAEVQSDTELRLQMTELKDKFMNNTQALIHGDLHTGSIMVTGESTVVIDPEFAFFGPIGFDSGAILANFFLAWFSQDGLATQDSVNNNRQQYKVWLADTAVQIWELFVEEFLGLWNSAGNSVGDGYNIIPSSQPEFQQVQKRFIDNLFADSLGFAASKMIRRIIGIAHVADLESIKDVNVRSSCEIKVLNFARKIAKERRTGKFTTIRDVVKELR